MRILLVEDNPRLASALSSVLTGNHYAVDVVGSSSQADAALAVQSFDAVILDLNLPDGDGLGVLKRLRQRDDPTPVLVLTARGDLDDRVKGLDLGADDYVTKPFEVSELEARLRVLLRRAAGVSGTQVTFGPLVLDLRDEQLHANGELLELSLRELGVLRALLYAKGRILPKSRILDSLSTFDEDLSDNAIEQVVSRLRKKLAPHAVIIRSARGLGYYLHTEKPPA